MRILLNLLPLKTGGGVQVALDFLNNVAQYGKQHEWHVICRQNMPFVSLCNEHIKLAAAVPDNITNRLAFEWFGHTRAIRHIRPQIAFTLFGPHLRVKNATNIGGCAYSNLFYPEIDFWRGLPAHKKLFKKFIDHLRKSRLKANDVCIFETDDLATRAKKVLRPNQQSICIKPSCSSLVSQNTHHEATQKLCNKLPNIFKIALISGYHPNKNIDFLGSIAKELRTLGESEVCFVLTLPPANKDVQEFFSRIQSLGLQNYFHNLGPIPQEGCAEVYRTCSASVLPSNLESFSNMIAESWAMKKPLFISDQSWARSICKEGALYYPHLNAQALAERICALKNRTIDYEACIMRGTEQLGTYPTSKERFLQYLALIEDPLINGTESLSPGRQQQLQKQEYLS